MRWIKSLDVPWRAFALAVAVLTAGCSTNATFLPAGDRQMIDIYREALSDQSSSGSGIAYARRACEALRLAKQFSIEDCVEVLNDAEADALRDLDRPSASQPFDYRAYTRSATNELESLFPRLPNPDIEIYVYPHLATRSRAPIPGYSSVIPLYERVEYRLPGEALLDTPIPVSNPAPQTTRATRNTQEGSTP
ncbi:MAG: TIGR03751 family conjugal transfer lipoprotein [Pseudomonadota bacterium]